MLVLKEVTVPSNREEPCPLKLADTEAGYHIHATTDVMTDNPGRLRRFLRDVAKAADPLQALAQSALHSFVAANPTHKLRLVPDALINPTANTARALADLSVTG